MWQGRFFDRAVRTVKEYHEKVEYIHLNPVKPGGVAGSSGLNLSLQVKGRLLAEEEILRPQSNLRTSTEEREPNRAQE